MFRIEDTDAARDSEESYAELLDALRWLGLDWDEGPEVGGPHGPYRQSERLDIYADVARGCSRPGTSTIALHRRGDRGAAQARRPGPELGYDGTDRDARPTQQRAAYRGRGPRAGAAAADARRATSRSTTSSRRDHLRGRLVPDFVLVRANGQPLYTLVNPVDDALMGITHVLRGEDLLSSTPRQIALYRGARRDRRRRRRAGVRPPAVRDGRGQQKLSKRDPESTCSGYRDAGFLPEGLLNYLALLGWSIADDRDIFTIGEMVAAFDVAGSTRTRRASTSKKCRGDQRRPHPRCSPRTTSPSGSCRTSGGGLLAAEPTAEQRRCSPAAAPLVQERMHAAGRGARPCSASCSSPTTPSPSTRTAAAKCSTTTRRAGRWRRRIDGARRAGRLDDRRDRGGAAGGARRRARPQAAQVAFGPLRVAVTGRRISPPLFESMEILGRDVDARPDRRRCAPRAAIWGRSGARTGRLAPRSRGRRSPRARRGDTPWGMG